jgi:hypothetical protein
MKFRFIMKHPAGFFRCNRLYGRLSAKGGNPMTANAMTSLK